MKNENQKNYPDYAEDHINTIDGNPVYEFFSGMPLEKKFRYWAVRQI